MVSSSTHARRPEWRLCDRIQRARDEAGMKRREELALAVGVAERTVYNWEHGISSPRAEQVAKIASATGVDVAWLLGLDEREGVRDLPTSQLVGSSAEVVSIHPGQGRLPIIGAAA